MSEYERPDRSEREPSIDDVRQLVGAATPHFALHIRNRLRNLVAGVPADHPARIEAEREIARLERIAVEGEHRGQAGQGEPELPSVQLPGGA